MTSKIDRTQDVDQKSRADLRTSQPESHRTAQGFSASPPGKPAWRTFRWSTVLDKWPPAACRQLLRFLIVGVFNTAFGYGMIFACMYLAGLSAEISNLIGYGISLTTSYLLHRNYTFRSKQRHRGEIVRFLAVFAIAYAANLIALIVFVREMRVHEGVSQILAGTVYVLTSYLMNRWYVFKISGTK